ncbi:hypothetical protein [Jeongeupia chitinilytica]|uniref:C2H2-type domain-containing protein n=1 Tax=Jeongeupia chitinilytica TaxID=1041641 RepID=A0ABQ3GZ21_9NEIS|nr:hypothetical protein [Jeongeupia chitinilytica]GHD59724.1 hypothetical protein GCM10007350_11360 [Jeongeupia chitinilytica]
MAPPQKQRYYIHGDQSESDAARYYCAECDVFFPESHFSETHRVKNYDRYDIAMRMLKTTKKNSNEYFRPEFAENLFS